MNAHQYRIGRDRALFVVSFMLLLASTTVGAMSYPMWAETGNSPTVSLLAMAEGQIDLFDVTQRQVVGDVLRSHGVSRKPGQEWMAVLQGLSDSKVGEIAGDLQKKLGDSSGNRSTTRKTRRTGPPTNTVQGPNREFMGSMIAIPGGMAAPWMKARGG